MANYRKSFNLRNGVQVDDDNFIVNANGLVGIGTSIPVGYLLNVYGDTRITGLVTTGNLYSRNLNTGNLYAGVTTVTSLNATQGATVSGVVTATSFSGSAAGLTGIYSIAVDGWIVNSGSSSISTSFKVGVQTTAPLYSLQIGEDPLFYNGISFDASTGNIKSTGIITASSFDGSLNASNLTSGTISNSVLPSSISVGIVTASTGFYGDLTGVASTASSITSTANITVNSVNSGFSTSGISTVYTKLHVAGNLGIGTDNPNAQLHVRKSGISSIQLTSDGTNPSTITFGRNVSIASSNGQIRFGNTDGTYTYSTEKSVDIINYDTGNLNFYLNPGGSGTGSYNWFKPSLGLIMTLTSTGNLGINSSSPTSTLSVVGDANISGIATITGATTVGGNLSATGNLTVNGSSTLSSVVTSGNVGVATNNASYTLQVGSNPATSNGVGISSTGDIITSGIITATNGFTSGIGVTNPVKISVLGNQLTFTVNGVGSTTLTLY